MTWLVQRDLLGPWAAAERTRRCQACLVLHLRVYRTGHLVLLCTVHGLWRAMSSVFDWYAGLESGNLSMLLSDIAALYSPLKKVRVTWRDVHRRRRRRPHGRGSGAGSQSKVADRLMQEQLQHPSRVKRTLNQGVGEGLRPLSTDSSQQSVAPHPRAPHPLPTRKFPSTPPPGPSVPLWLRATRVGMGDGDTRPRPGRQVQITKIHWRAAARGERQSERQGGGA